MGLGRTPLKIGRVRKLWVNVHGMRKLTGKYVTDHDNEICLCKIIIETSLFYMSSISDDRT